MPDDQALRARRSRLHRAGDHSLCKADRCDAARHGPPVEVLPVAEAARDGEARLVATYREALERAGRNASPDGLHVLHLAEMFATGKHTAAGAAALSRELRAAMEVALQGAPRQADELDELAARRDRKAAGA